MSIKNYFTKKQNMYLKVLQLRYCGRDSIIQVRNRPYFHYGSFERTKNKQKKKKLLFIYIYIKQTTPLSNLRSWRNF